MPSPLHETLIQLFRNRPDLAPNLLRDGLSAALPQYTEVKVESADLTEVQPAEYRADLVLSLSNGKPVLGIIVEVQLSIDARKQFTWPRVRGQLAREMALPSLFARDLYGYGCSSMG